MNITTNVAGIRNTNQLNGVAAAAQRTRERMASGRQINRAADNAAGLAISELLINQIAGLDQAINNSLDSISLVQTAEGALEEVHRMGERIRELTVQASNDTLSSNDRRLVGLEINQLMNDIDRIISDTQFNGMNLLGGNRGSLAEGIRRTADTNFNVARDSFDLAQTTFDNANRSAQNVFDSSTALATATRDAAIASQDANRATSVATATEARATAMEAATATRSAAIEAATATFAASNGDAEAAANLNESIAAADLAFATTQAAENDIFNTAVDAANTAHATGVSAANEAFGVAQVEANQTLLVSNMTAQNAFNTAQNALNSARDAHSLATNSLSSTGARSIGTQSGPNSLQRIGVNLNSIQVYADRMRAGMWSPGQSGADISRTLSGIDNFVRNVSQQRATLGATQNRLSHTVNSLRETSINTTSANSRIRDSDMARESMNFHRNNILTQVGLSMQAHNQVNMRAGLRLLG